MGIVTVFKMKKLEIWKKQYMSMVTVQEQGTTKIWFQLSLFNGLKKQNKTNQMDNDSTLRENVCATLN